MKSKTEEMKELEPVYGVGAVKKTVSVLGNAVIEYANGETKVFFRDSVDEILDPKGLIDKEAYYTLSADISIMMNKSVNGISTDLRNLSNGHLIPMTNSLTAIERILIQKNICSVEELEQLREEIADEAIKAGIERDRQKMKDAAYAHSTVIAKIVAERGTEEEIAKAREIINATKNVLHDKPDYMDRIVAADKLFTSIPMVRRPDGSVIYTVDSACYGKLTEKEQDIVSNIFEFISEDNKHILTA